MSVLLAMISETTLAVKPCTATAGVLRARHGIIDEPKCRAFLCSAEGGALNINCGQAEWEPQSLEGPKGFPDGGPEDGAIASAGVERFAALDEQSADRWQKQPIKTGHNTLHWRLAVQHRTESWQLYITRPDWDPDKPLSRVQFDLHPLVDKSGEDEVPPECVTLNYTIPENYSGYHVLLAVWSVADTGNAFYQVIDTDIS
ncbi:lytic polysaccharide monooxygenase [Candidatus Sodalis sp. SoCistrobi]|uniref:lytic polysaccharide monooxygenase n=1 Tax=Candidatus Sodalis sp. SoCistrobi TaxID=1922216 RepID=UPI00093EF750|nr:lytic polysaccharide monooxygenase [Candidatus Sodalis sp. SoCistrobi]